MTLWGTHTNQALCCINGEVPHANTDMTVEGKLNPAKIGLKDPQLLEAANRGLQWDVIPHEVLAPHMPRIATLLQSAGNAPAQ
eukprot:9738171-Karenia_brevis.AAC.1